MTKYISERRQRIEKALRRNGNVSDALLAVIEAELLALWPEHDAVERQRAGGKLPLCADLLAANDAYHKGEEPDPTYDCTTLGCTEGEPCVDCEDDEWGDDE